MSSIKRKTWRPLASPSSSPLLTSRLLASGVWTSGWKWIFCTRNRTTVSLSDVTSLSSVQSAIMQRDLEQVLDKRIGVSVCARSRGKSLPLQRRAARILPDWRLQHRATVILSDKILKRRVTQILPDWSLQWLATKYINWQETPTLSRTDILCKDDLVTIDNPRQDTQARSNMDIPWLEALATRDTGTPWLEAPAPSNQRHSLTRNSSDE